MIKFFHIDPITQKKGGLAFIFNEDIATEIFTSSMKIYKGKIFVPILRPENHEKYKIAKGTYLTAEDEAGLPWRSFHTHPKTKK